MSLGGIGVIDFQLYLLKTMDPAPSFLAGSLKALDRSIDDMLASFEAVSPLLKTKPGSATRLKLILDDAFLEDRRIESLSLASAYRLSLWPMLDFLVSTDESGLFIGRAGFQRRIDSETSSSLAAWNFLEGDLADAFGDVSEIDAWGHYSTYIAQDSASGRKYFLRFGWGLLQEVVPQSSNP